MKKFFTSILCVSALFSAYAAEKMIFEAENFKGNSIVQDDADAAGGNLCRFSGGFRARTKKQEKYPQGFCLRVFVIYGASVICR